jgi:hypothetical protein
MDASLFRLALDHVPRIDVSLEVDGTTSASGKLVHIHGKGAGARFARVGAPDLFLAQELRIHFASVPDRSGTVSLQARASLRRDEEKERAYHFLFRSPEEVEHKLAPWLRTISDSPSLKVRVTSSLVDLCEGGLSLQVSLEEEEHFLSLETVQASFVLPSTPSEEISLEARILERRLSGSRALLVLAFVPKRTARFYEQEEAIRRFVNEHQRRLLKRA